MSERDALVARLQAMADYTKVGHSMNSYDVSILKKAAAALTAPQQEPVARVKRNSGCGGREFIGESLEFRDLPVGTKLYTAPPSGVREGMLLNRADVLLAYAYMEERNFPDIAACRVIQQAHEIITRAAEQVNAVRPDCGEAGHADNACGNLQCLPSASQPDTVAVPRDQLEHWAEYWNGSANEKAMSDALEHILGEVDNLLAQEAK